MHWGLKVPGSFLSSRAATVGFLRRRPFRVVRQKRARARTHTHTHTHTHIHTHQLLLMLHVLDSTFMFCRDSVSKYRSTPSSGIPCSRPRHPLLHTRNMMVTGPMPSMLALVPKTPCPRGCYLFESTLSKICVYWKKFPCIRLFPLYFIKLPLFIPRKPVGDWRTNST